MGINGTWAQHKAEMERMASTTEATLSHASTLSSSLGDRAVLCALMTTAATTATESSKEYIVLGTDILQCKILISTVNSLSLISSLQPPFFFSTLG